MKCPHCGSTSLKVTGGIDSEATFKKNCWPVKVPRNNSRFRSRRCEDCLSILWTLEQIIDREALMGRSR